MSIEKLSSREREVFYHVARDAMTNAQIAGRLGLSRKTVETHRANINRKLGVHSSVQLLRYAVTHRLLETAPPPASDPTIFEPMCGWEKGLRLLLEQARCPYCQGKISSVKTEGGELTWECAKGCNP